MHEPTSDSNEDLVSFLDLDINSLLAESVDAFRLPQEHYLHLVSLREGIYKLAQGDVDPV